MSDVRPGYKRSEVGIIPEDWTVASIDDHAHITTGSKNTQDRIADGEYPFFVRSQTVERINSYSFDGEAVLTAGDGVGTGKVFHYINNKFDVHQRVYRISNFSQQLRGDFFFRVFSTRFYDRIMAMTAKSSVDSVRREMIAKMTIPLPPLAEQKAIADALGNADALIDGLEALIAKKRDIKQGAMQELLTGLRRLPGFAGDWEAKRLADLATIDGDNLGAGTPGEYAFRYISLEDVDDGVLTAFSEQRFASAPSRARRKLVVGDVLVSTVRPNLKSHLLFDRPGTNWICSTGFSVVRSTHASLDPEFLFQTLFSERIERQIEMLLVGSNYPAINSKDVKGLHILAPSYAEQRAISAVLSDLDAEIAALDAKLAKVRAVKHGMMQVLLTGEVRLA